MSFEKRQLGPICEVSIESGPYLTRETKCIKREKCPIEARALSLALALNISSLSSAQIQPEFNFLPNMNISKHEHSSPGNWRCSREHQQMKWWCYCNYKLWNDFDLSLDFINASLNINPFDAIGYDFDWFPSRLQQQRSNKGAWQPLL